MLKSNSRAFSWQAQARHPKPIDMEKSFGEQAVDEAIEKARDFLRDNPAFAVAGAALVSEIFSALSPTAIRKGSSRAAIRDWVGGAYESMPEVRQFKSAAKSAGVPTTFHQAKIKAVEFSKRLLD